jgi:hypothetical protein
MWAVAPCGDHSHPAALGSVQKKVFGKLVLRCWLDRRCRLTFVFCFQWLQSRAEDGSWHDISFTNINTIMLNYRAVTQPCRPKSRNNSMSRCVLSRMPRRLAGRNAMKITLLVQGCSHAVRDPETTSTSWRVLSHTPRRNARLRAEAPPASSTERLCLYTSPRLDVRCRSSTRPSVVTPTAAWMLLCRRQLGRCGMWVDLLAAV